MACLCAEGAKEHLVAPPGASPPSPPQPPRTANSYLKPMKENWSQNQASPSISSMLGKAKPNQEAKFRMSPFSGNNLQAGRGWGARCHCSAAPQPSEEGSREGGRGPAPGCAGVPRTQTVWAAHKEAPPCLDWWWGLQRGSGKEGVDLGRPVQSEEGAPGAVGGKQEGLPPAMGQPEGTYWFIWPFRTRFGPVPVSVAVPPMLAA